MGHSRSDSIAAPNGTVAHRQVADARLAATPPNGMHVSGAPGLDPLTPTIFHAPWWLEAASGHGSDQVEVQSGGRTVGRLPFKISKHVLGLRLCSAPELCHALGPAVDPGAGSLITRRSNRFEITRELIAQLPKCHAYFMPLHAGATETFAFTEAQWDSAAQFTFVVHPLGEAVLWKAMRDKTRNVLRRAAERHQVQDLLDPAEFERAYSANLAARKVRNYYGRIKPVCEAALNHGRGRILAVRAECGKILAAIVVVWDERAMYYLLTTRSADADNSIVSLLVWHAIKLANAKSLVFDFDCVGAPGSRLFFSGFGGEIEPRYLVERNTVPYRCGRWVRSTVRNAARLLPTALAPS